MPILSTGTGTNYYGTKPIVKTAKAVLSPTKTAAYVAPTYKQTNLAAMNPAVAPIQNQQAKTASQLASEALAAAVNYQPQTVSYGGGGYEGGGGGGTSYQEAGAVTPAATATPTTTITPYTPQAYNVNLPTIDWSFNPTGEQRTGWNTQATATAGQEIDPQLQAIKTALEQYMAQGQNTRNELNPRYTNQSLGIANIIQNTVKQEAINNAIRRGADTSGWLTSALTEAGQLETEQRGDVEAQRNQDLNALAALETQQTQAAGEQNVGLEKLRGQRITTALADLENQAWTKAQQEKESQWSSALGGEQLRASNYGANESNLLSTYQTQVGANQSESQRAMEAAVAAAENQLGYYNTDAQTAMSAADRELQASIAENEQSNAVWGQNYQTSQDTYQRQLDAAKTSQSSVSTKAKTPTYTYNGVSGLDAKTYLYYKNLDADRAAKKQTGGTSDEDLLRQLGLID